MYDYLVTSVGGTASASGKEGGGSLDLDKPPTASRQETPPRLGDTLVMLSGTANDTKR